ncbi:MAG: chalcone isomerase family protein [bacterium]|nr:chalcone isomerase family protein [bacterium]MDT8396297.1 chalcone isomerase family protein [bacterium]
MKNLTIIVLALLLSAAWLPAASAAELAGVTLDDSITIGSNEVALAGMGIRTKTFLKVKVYVAGLYMENPGSDAGQIIGSDQAKAMVMQFLYKEVEGEKLQEAWREGFDANTLSPTDDLKKRMDRFVSLFTESALKDEKYIFAYEPGKGTTISLKGKVRATIPGADFAGALMAIWFGEKMGDGGLKALKDSLLEGTN